MPRIEAPAIDGRTHDELVTDVERLIEQYTGQPAAPEGDAGWALVRVFSRLAELAVTRLDRLPDRNFLAFLDLIGTRLDPPQAARVPLTFLLAKGSPVDGLVPAGTQAAALPLEGEAEAPVFETERDLVVTRSQLVAACTREPGRDLWADHTAIATGETAGIFQPFRGDRPIEHRLHLTHPLFGLPEPKTIELRITPADESLPWLEDVIWEIWDGTAWQTLHPYTLFHSDGPATWVVELSDVPGIAASTVNGYEGPWLQGRLDKRLIPGDGLPSIDSLSIRVEVERNWDLDEDIQPDRGFAGSTPLDLGRDFLPFGERPKTGDVFYLASDEAFSKPNAEVNLSIYLTSSDSNGTTTPAARPDSITWEFWDGRDWQLLSNFGFDDGTERFLESGTVSFFVPPTLAAVEVNGETRRWIRVRIARGNYGVDAHYVPVVVNGVPKRDANGLPLYELVPATFRPPSLRKIRISYWYDSEDQEPERVVTENDFTFENVSERPFMPFVPAKDLRSTLYLGFERPGDAIGFANRAMALFFQVSEAAYDPAVEPQPVTEEASVVWEHWNGETWERLGSRDETHGLACRGLLTFIGPPDFRISTEFGRTAFWLRGRWERGGYAVEPWLARVLTNTTWAINARTLEGEVLGSSRGERGQVFHTLHAPVLDGQQLEVIEPEIPSRADLDELAAEEGDDAVTAVRDASGRFLAAQVRWHEVPDFYGSGPRSRHYMIDHMTGEIRFGDGRRGLVPPPGRDNIRMLRYQAGGGLAGNRPAGSIAQLRGTVPYVNSVVQHMPAQGGAAEESLEAARVSGPKSLRHRGRAIAAADFEDLALQATPQVARAQTLPAKRPSEGGQVGLIVVPLAKDAKPVPDLELLARVKSYVEARLSPVVDFRVVGPDWLQIDIRAEIVPQQLEAAAGVQTAVIERLHAFLHPLSGGPLAEGWEFGRRPHRSDLYALIEETPGVDHVRRLEVIETPREGGARPGRFLVFSGKHEITLFSSVDAASDPGSLP